MFKGPQGFALFVNVAMNIVLGIVLTVFVDISIEMRLGVHFMTVEAVVGTFISSFCVGFTAGTLVPAMTWGMKLAGLFKFRPGGLGSYLCCAVVLGLCMGICITFCNFLIAGLGTKGLAGAMADIMFNLPVVLILAVIAVPIFLRPVQLLAAKVSGFDPAKAEKAQQH
ncbi:hypothetical protein DMP06_06210 [Slackia equolifaciens]|uniref:DUF2798 domain-containing protein n=2 Tax=Bacillati TaxID=1783272 RepID=A0A3N0B008_9ACTN|nr:hypothetical protein [Slackia equolifaciens]RNL39926.1 hypothetical protein DMP06_06210 [Slackia equolifaciens]BAJ72749.1 unnamed protein product [Lactococcus garvieae]